MNFRGTRLGFWNLGSPASFSWETTQDGIIAGQPGGWYISNGGLMVRFVIQDSFNCGGFNNNIQSGTAIGTFYTAATPYLFYYDLSGIGENQDTGYEAMQLSLETDDVETLLTTATSTDLDLGCLSFGPVIQTTLVPSPVYLNSYQTYKFKLEFTTNDPLYHIGCYYQCSLNLIRTS